MTDYIRDVIDASGEVSDSKPEFKFTRTCDIVGVLRVEANYGLTRLVKDASGHYVKSKPCRSYLCQEQRECQCQ